MWITLRSSPFRRCRSVLRAPPNPKKLQQKRAWFFSSYEKKEGTCGKKVRVAAWAGDLPLCPSPAPPCPSPAPPCLSPAPTHDHPSWKNPSRRHTRDSSLPFTPPRCQTSRRGCACIYIYTHIKEAVWTSWKDLYDWGRKVRVYIYIHAPNPSYNPKHLPPSPFRFSQTRIIRCFFFQWEIKSFGISAF